MAIMPLIVPVSYLLPLSARSNMQGKRLIPKQNTPKSNKQSDDDLGFN